MRKVGIAVLIVIGVALYLNFGWWYGDFMYKANSGPDSFLKTLVTVDGALGWNSNNAFHSFVWPFSIVLNATGWAVKGFLYLLWLIFAGGIVKGSGLI